MQFIKKLLMNFGIDIKRSKSQQTLESNLRSIFDFNKVDLILDVGANKGQYGKFLRFLGYTGDIISFEPVAPVFQLLVDAAKDDPRWTVVNLGLGDKKEEKVINFHSQSSDFSSILAINKLGLERFGGLENPVPLTINIETLDNFFRDAPQWQGKKTFLKMDTQGYDLQVFRGAHDTLKQFVAIQAELSFQGIYEGMPTYLESLKEFEQKGFTVSGLFPVSRHSNHSLIEADCVLVRNA